MGTTIPDELREVWVGEYGHPVGGAEWVQLVRDAIAWRRWMSWRRDEAERVRRRQMREISHDLSAAANWSAVSGEPSYAELEVRRRLPGPDTPCSWPGCGSPRSDHGHQRPVERVAAA